MQARIYAVERPRWTVFVGPEIALKWLCFYVHTATHPACRQGLAPAREHVPLFAQQRQRNGGQLLSNYDAKFPLTAAQRSYPGNS